VAIPVSIGVWVDVMDNAITEQSKPPPIQPAEGER
jgi:hypothetical protein